MSKIFAFTEEIAFKHFLLTNITKFRLFSVRWKSFKDHDVYMINFFRMSHYLKRNLFKLDLVRKEKNPKLKSSYLHYIMEKNHEI